ncbi:MAG: hypothetical protein WCP85_08200 [Mariniphaga sp.]
MKKISLIIIALLLSGSISFAKDGKRDVIYLKNGSIIKGQILKDYQSFTNTEGIVRIKTKDNSLWVFKATEIDSIRQSQPNSGYDYHIGYFNLTEAGILAGNSKNKYDAPFSLMNISGWQFKNRFSVGIGAGVEMMSETYLPVVADIRYHLKKQGTNPFFGIQGGYTFALDKPDPQYVYTTTGIWGGSGSTLNMKARGGFLVNPFVGLVTPLNESMALTFSAGYRIMRHRYHREDNYNIDMDYNRLTVKIGLLFQ